MEKDNQKLQINGLRGLLPDKLYQNPLNLMSEDTKNPSYTLHTDVRDPEKTYLDVSFSHAQKNSLSKFQHATEFLTSNKIVWTGISVNKHEQSVNNKITGNILHNRIVRKIHIEGTQNVEAFFMLMQQYSSSSSNKHVTIPERYGVWGSIIDPYSNSAEIADLILDDSLGAKLRKILDVKNAESADTSRGKLSSKGGDENQYHEPVKTFLQTTLGFRTQGVDALAKTMSRLISHGSHLRTEWMISH